MPSRLLAALVAVTLAAAALAQHGSMSMGLYGEASSFRPELSSRDIKLIIRVLHLGPDSEKALMDLYAGYDGALQSEGSAVREFVNEHIDKAEAMNDPALLAPAQKRLGEWSTRSEQIKKQFLDDLKSLLTRDQESRWPIVERELRRLKTIGDGRLCGESIDLTALTEDVTGGPPSTPELTDLINRYCEDMDHALTARVALIKDKSSDYADKLKSNPKGAEAIWRDVTRARAAVRDVNDRYERLIAAQLPADKAKQLADRYFEESNRPISKPTRAEEYLKDAQALKTLTDDQKPRLAQVKAKYDAEKHAVLEKESRAWRDFEMEWKPEELAKALGEKTENDYPQQYNGAWLPEASPLVQTRKERLDLDLQLRKSLDALLTEDQRSAIPNRLAPYARFDNWSPYGL